MIKRIFSEANVRQIDEDARFADFVAATEAPVMTWAGPEIALMSGVDLKRYSSNPVVLDSHVRDEVNRIIGRTEFRIENKQLLARVYFAATERAAAAWELVRTGFLRALSVGFIPKREIVVETGKALTIEGRDVQGPAVIITEWELYEISAVAVPADADAVRRGLEDTMTDEEKKIAEAKERELKERELKERELKERELKEREAKERELKERELKERELKEREAKERELKERDIKEREAKELAEKQAAETAAQKRKDEIYAITPRGYETVADKCVIAGLDVEAARKRILSEMEKRCAPVGTPEPAPIPSSKEAPKTEMKEMTDEDFKQAIQGM